MNIAIMALQGAFEEHEQMLGTLGADTFLIRNREDWSKQKDALVIPGGESTAMMRIMRDEELFQPVREEILAGLPVFGTCAGLIMLDHEHLDTMDMKARRNAYGRQLGSFNTEATFRGIGEIPMTFIRAPYIETLGPGAECLAEVDGRMVAAIQERQLVTAFHPELTADTRVHEYFLEIVRDYSITSKHC